MKRSEIQIRDPFIVPNTSEQLYYLFGTTCPNCWEGMGTGFDYYISRDLEEWDGPHPAFRPAPDFWADRNFWAPEVHAYQGRAYMFASFKAEDRCRGTQILAADTLRGPFLPLSDGPVTPLTWECLDGTLHVDAQGNPWIVFCHEWVQVQDGEICALRLSPDLSTALGAPQLLFRASSASWVKQDTPEARQCLVTDGPFLHRTADGTLLMLWSSFTDQGYAIGIARSLSGDVLGPWEHETEPLFAQDGGHGMLFRTFAGELLLTIHRPNVTPQERPILLPISEEDGRLVAGAIVAAP